MRAPPSPFPSSKLDIDRGGSKAGGGATLIKLVCRGGWQSGGDSGRSRVMDRGRKSVLRDKRRRDDVHDATEVGGSTSEVAAWTARRDGARQRHKLELPLAVHTRVSSRAMSLVTPSAGGATSWQTRLTLGYLRTALDIDLGNKARLVAGVEDLERWM